MYNTKEIKCLYMEWTKSRQTIQFNCKSVNPIANELTLFFGKIFFFFFFFNMFHFVLLFYLENVKYESVLCF